MTLIVSVIGPGKIAKSILLIDILAIDDQICFWETITPSNMRLLIGQAASHETASSGSVL